MNMFSDSANLVTAMKNRALENAKSRYQDQIQAEARAGLPEHATGEQGAAARAIRHRRSKR